MEEYLLFVRANVANVKGICNFTFLGPNSVIISNSCDFMAPDICPG